MKTSTILTFSLLGTRKEQVFQNRELFPRAPNSPVVSPISRWSGCLLRMWRNKLPPLICLTLAADTNLNLSHLWQETESLSRCLFQQTCLSPCFSIHISPPWSGGAFHQKQSIPMKSLGFDESTFSAEKLPTSSGCSAWSVRADLCLLQRVIQNTFLTRRNQWSNATDLLKASRRVTLDLCCILVVP